MYTEIRMIICNCGWRVCGGWTEDEARVVLNKHIDEKHWFMKCVYKIKNWFK